MRRLAFIPVVFALLIASVMAPYQHVHLRLPGRHSFSQDDDDDSAIVHIHFALVSLPAAGASPSIAAPGDDQVTRALDILAFLLHPPLQLSAPPVSRASLAPLVQLRERVTERVEACAHDPPAIALAVPRAPPA